MKVSIKFKRLQKKIDDLFMAHDDDKYNFASCAIQCAEENAVDTCGLTKDEEYYRIAYGSICCTSYFEDNQEVQNIFTKLGYAW